ncbi:MAG: hypothetical protein FWD69_07755 [Polyangiaceae bacterium]|nr:hypothetical protein [Polyangiaceae bacterium]
MKRILILSVASLLSVVACGTQSSGSRSGGGTPSTIDSGNNGSSGQDQDSTPPPPSKVNVTNETIQSGGTTRSYVLAVPKTYDDARAYPLVLVLHGDWGDGPGTRASYTFDDVTGDDAIVVYPTGNVYPGNAWVQSLDVDSYDMRFLRDLVDALKEKFTIDPNRIFGVGYSSGGFMVNYVACMIPMFRGIASNEGGMASTDDGSPLACTAGPTATIIIHDPDDSAVDVSSGEWDAEYWAEQANCTDALDKHGNHLLPTTQVAPPQCSAYNGCNPSYPVTLCLVPGIGHNWWWPEGATATWAFFQALP